MRLATTTKSPRLRSAGFAERARGSLMALALGAAVVSCGTALPVQRAEEGKWKMARDALDKSPVDSEKSAKKLARAVLAREIAQSDEIEDRAFIRSLSACDHELTDALEQRARAKDSIAAEAALLLLDSGAYSVSQARRHVGSPDDAWRAVGARTTGTSSATETRQALFEDDDQRVRRAALHAALEFASEADIEPLLEVARLDPDPLTRSRAYQALARIGSERVLLALKDRYTQAEQTERLAILDAWGQALRDDGGSTQLERIVDQSSGLERLHAAYLLSRHPDLTLRRKGLSRLLHFAEHGTTDEQRLALRRLPEGEPASDQLLLTSTMHVDPQVRVIAWARLTGRPEHRAAAISALLEMARSDEPERYQARAALAAAGAEKARSLFEQQATARNEALRRIAGSGLLRLEAWEELGRLLVDAEEKVRRPIACRVLAHD